MKNKDDVSKIAIKNIKFKWLHDIKIYIKILYYKLIIR